LTVPAPHFLLFSEATAARPGRFVAYANSQLKPQTGHWRFVLESVDGDSTLEAADHEPQASSERLELLAVVRGLEALNQPSRVTLLTSSRYVNRGIRYGLDEWRENHWQWECFGKMMPVKNGDLWRRVDRALKIHNVNCRTWVAEWVDSVQQWTKRPTARSIELAKDSERLSETEKNVDSCDGEKNVEAPEYHSSESHRRDEIPAKQRARFSLPGVFRLGRARMSG